jgi:predicted nucleic acid-binding protein
LAIPVNETVAAAFGLMKADQDRLCRRVPDLDLLIAATARVNGLVVATLDFRHFPLIEGVCSGYQPIFKRLRQRSINI